MFGRADANSDGVLERAEVLQRADARFTKLDANGDGSLEQTELKGWRGRFGKKHAGRHHQVGRPQQEADRSGGR